MAIRTARWDDWTLADLVAAKGDTRVSLVVPARNEVDTVGGVVTRVRERLVDTVRLVDEIVVIDSDSVDGTYDAAASAGADVYRSAQIRPDLGTHAGKGEAMWKSQFVISGDVIVFMDADLLDWDTHFVPGLLGPLLTDPGMRLVKGFYERPGEQGPLDGGRVTELVARPLVSLLFPDLADVVQPLAGEWAVRRAHFASLSVPVGYAVELAALIDTLAEHGPASLAQVDLGVRSHPHQSLLDLGAMATQILAAALARAESAEVDAEDASSRQKPADEAANFCRLDLPGLRASAGSAVLRQFLPGPTPVDRVVEVVERPPAVEHLSDAALDAARDGIERWKRGSGR